MNIILLSPKEKELVLALICEKQIHMITNNPRAYMNEEYNKLEQLKVKVKDLETEEK